MGRQIVYKRVRRATDKLKHKIILDYMKDNREEVLNSSVTTMKGMPFFTRFRFAVDILLGKKKRSREGNPGRKKEEARRLP